jgi:hypothetical protein
MIKSYQVRDGTYTSAGKSLEADPKCGDLVRELEEVVRGMLKPVMVE